MILCLLERSWGPYPAAAAYGLFPDSSFGFSCQAEIEDAEVRRGDLMLGARRATSFSTLALEHVTRIDELIALETQREASSAFWIDESCVSAKN